ncbi:hypothetical protein GM3708_2723 [Geminocystis sp. NIES-3708]|uniref:hypothetical protein n=1 Tax=Geminocystis sp. NIES-3708 TaxID=1615909 RepID=UPI0005FC5BD9|nr:hypothetical protein [Geminocystis sp. NIES-3708]BAQ62317.1 hypothetical protein GM3708_2723 [Geminocystis sp. NIES-3708]
MSKTTSDNGFEDEELVNFLKTYCPNTPPETKSCEELVMKAIADHNSQITSESNHWQKKPQKIMRYWLLSGTLITTLSVILGGYFFNLNQKSAPQIAAQTEDLETFLINSWYGSMAQESQSHLVTVSDEY